MISDARALDCVSCPPPPLRSQVSTAFGATPGDSSCGTCDGLVRKDSPPVHEHDNEDRPAQLLVSQLFDSPEPGLAPVSNVTCAWCVRVFCVLQATRCAPSCRWRGRYQYAPSPRCYIIKRTTPSLIFCAAGMNAGMTPVCMCCSLSCARLSRRLPACVACFPSQVRWRRHAQVAPTSAATAAIAMAADGR